jgi:hypothetical protein
MDLNRRKSRARQILGQIAIAGAIVMSVTMFSTASFAAGTAKQREACTPDVMRLCFSSVFSGDQAIIACMTKNKDKLSRRCKMTLPPI